MIESRPVRLGGEYEPSPVAETGRQAAADTLELAAALRRHRVAVIEYPFDPPVRALLIRRGRRRWVGLARDSRPAARRGALLEIVRVLEADPGLLFYLVEDPPAR